MTWKGWVLLLLVLVLAAVTKPSLRPGDDKPAPSPSHPVVTAELDSDAQVAQASAPPIVAQDQAAEPLRSAGPDQVAQRFDATDPGWSPAADTPDLHAALEAIPSQAALAVDELAREKARSVQLQDSLAKTLASQADWEGAERQATAAAIAEFRRRTRDTAALARQIDDLRQRLKDAEAASASQSRDLAGVRESLASADKRAALAEDAQRALQASARDTEEKLGQERDKAASLAAELAKANATIADLQARAAKPQADAGPVQTLPTPSTEPDATPKAPVADDHAVKSQTEAPPQRSAELPRLPARPGPTAGHERHVQSSPGPGAARTASRAPVGPSHRPVRFIEQSPRPDVFAPFSFSNEGAYSMTMDDSHYDFGDFTMTRPNGGGLFDSGIETRKVGRPCGSHSCSLSRRWPIHLTKRSAARVAERRRD